MCDGLAAMTGFTGIFGFSEDFEAVAVSVDWETLEAGLGPDTEDSAASGDSEAELEAEEMLVSSPALVRVPVIVTSDSDMKLDSYDLAPCSVLVVQSEQPEVVEKEEILLSSSSTDLAFLACQLGARGRHVTGESGSPGSSVSGPG